MNMILYSHGKEKQSSGDKNGVGTFKNGFSDQKLIPAVLMK